MAFTGKYKTIEHEKAFDYYYALEGERSYNKVAIKFRKSLTTIYTWARAFDWRNEVKKRDAANAKAIKEKTDSIIVDKKVTYRKEIEVHLNILRASINKIIDKIKKKKDPLEIADMEDYDRFVRSYERLVKLDLLLAGEPTENIGHQIPQTFVEWMAYLNKQREANKNE